MNTAQRAAAAAKLEDLRAKALDAVNAFNDDINDLDEMVRELIEKHLQEKYVAARSAVEAFAHEAEDVARQLEDYIGPKSEAWQESELGRALQEIQSTLEDTSFEILDHDEITFSFTIDELDVDEVDDLSNTIEALRDA